MTNIYRSLLLVIAGASQKELARQIKYLKVENQILRSRLTRRLDVTPKERARLVKFAGKLAAKVLRQLVTIVHPDTLLRWVREDRRGTRKQAPVWRGRRRTPEQLRRLIRKMARENDWGYTRIMGELKKLGIRPPSRNTVKNILKKAGLEPGPKRGAGTWDEFLTRHAATLVQCDFLCKRIWTAQGLRDVFVLVFLHVGTRRAFVTPATTNPTEAWVKEQTREYLQHAKAEKLPVKLLFHDRDSKFSAATDADLARRNVEVRKTAFRAPNTNAFVERFIQTIQVELLDNFVVLGQRHFDHLVKVWLEHYHTERPHQAKDNDLLLPSKQRRKKKPTQASPPDDVLPLTEIRCEQRLGGVLKHYYRKAA